MSFQTYYEHAWALAYIEAIYFSLSEGLVLLDMFQLKHSEGEDRLSVIIYKVENDAINTLMTS